MPRRLERPDNRLFLGKGGSGKSYLARHQLAGASRVLIHDPNGEPAWAEGARVIYSRAELAEAMQARSWRIAWRGSQAARSEPEKIDAFEWANRCAIAAGDAVVVWDEADFFMGPARVPPNAYRIINAGRHHGLRIFACARRFRAIPRHLSANSQRIIVFRSTEPSDLKWVEQVMTREVAVMVPVLKEREAVDWSERTVKRKISPFR